MTNFCFFPQDFSAFIYYVFCWVDDTDSNGGALSSNEEETSYRIYWIYAIGGGTSGEFELTAPLISPKAKKVLGFFYTKDLFFSIGKKGKKANRLIIAPLYFFEKLPKGGGQLTQIPWWHGWIFFCCCF